MLFCYRNFSKINVTSNAYQISSLYYCKANTENSVNLSTTIDLIRYQLFIIANCDVYFY